VCVWSDQTELMAFLWFSNCNLLQALFLSLAINFYYFCSHLPVTTLH